MTHTINKSKACTTIARLCLAATLTATPAGLITIQAAIPTTLSAPDDTNVIVQGTVYEKAVAQPLPGASIAIYQGDKLITGTTSDLDGTFKIIVPVKNFDIRVSYMGMVTQTFQSSKTKDLQKMRIDLEDDSQQISNVVVTGFVDKNKETFTGSVTQISGVELKMVSNTNIIDAIAALTPGMSVVQNTAQGSNPNHVNELILRGTSSFSNQGQDVNQPTIILDGTEITMQELYDLDMNEVENINVLKDASATALYGSKAANGVIVITRKPIKNSKVRVQYNFTGDVQFPMLGDYDLLNAAEKLEYERLAGLYDAKGAIDSSTGLPQQYALDELYNERYKRIAAGQNSDWLSQPARIAISHDHSLRVYGGASHMRYELNARYGDTRGVMKGDYRKRTSIGFKLDYFIKDMVTLSNRTTYSEVDSKNTPYGSFSQYTKMNPYDPMYNEDGSVNTNLSLDSNNPLYEAKLGSYSKKGTHQLSNSTDVRWDINRMFRITGHLNLSSALGWSDSFTSPKSLTYKNETDLTKKGQLYKSDTRTPSYDPNVLGTFNHLFADNSLLSTSTGWAADQH